MRTEDGYIIYECLNGDKSAFALLIDKYKAAVFAIAYSKLLNFHDAEDIAQEVFIKAYQKLSTLKNYDKFIVWLHSITNNLCKDHIRSQSKRPDREYMEDQKTDLLDKPSMESYKDSLLNDLIHDALDSLPEVYRQVVTLHYLGGMKDSEIAEFLGISHTNVRQKLMRARTQLREEMTAMMGTAFEGQKLRANFTFKIVEAIKRIKIQPVSQPKGLPWGISLATGIIFVVVSINPHISQMIMPNTFAGSALPSESKVLKIGEIPVSIIKTAELSFIASQKGDSDRGKIKKPDNQESLMMAPKVEGDTWVRKADMPTAKRGISTCVIGDKIYVIGGCIFNGIYTSIKALEEYDPNNDKWQKKSDMPTPRDLFGIGVVNGKIYAIGGETLVGGGGWVTSVVEEYDPKQDKWTRKANMPTARVCAATVTLNEKIYVIGGNNDNFQANLQVLPNVEVYDPINDVWAKKANMPNPRSGSAFTVIDDKIYIIGGIIDNWFNGKLVSIVEEYDPLSDTWIKKSDIPVSTVNSSATTLNNKIFVFGGSDRINSLSAVYEYDPVKDKWIAKADMLTSKYMLSSSAINGKIYVIGGAKIINDNDIDLSVVEEYTPEGWPFDVSPQGKLPSTWGEIRQR